VSASNVELGQVREGMNAKTFPPRIERVSIAGHKDGAFRVLCPRREPTWLKPATIASRWPVVVTRGAMAKRRVERNGTP